ncbi:MAG: endonuclease/exonuclease/phosphatase family protein [Pseudarcicella sp.]|nr:endonuclease/exonuclease/phosphatase family protein [Pseudarcicella sp.]MBP6411673.1 endonuclease/exonuclease/phosphatase family protein [Pseudarcicella sp.]
MFKKILSSLIWLLSLPLFIYTLITYVVSYLLIIDHWLAGFVMMSMPVAMLACFIMAIFWLFAKPTRAILPILVLAIGYPFIKRTIAIHPTINPSEHKSIKLLSYNISSLYYDNYTNNENKSIDLLDFIQNNHNDADFKCFQEFYNDDTRQDFQSYKYIKKHFPYVAFTNQENPKTNHQGYLGICTFSKYPILHHFSKSFSNLANGYVVADIKMPKDTIRLINVQMYSMGIRVNRLTNNVTNKDFEKAKIESKSIIERLDKGFKSRKDEIAIIKKLIDDSKYPVIVVGDLNETPYGEAYGAIKNRLKNAFEDAGTGFGFTLNRMPRFVRIDNQFYSEEFQAQSLVVDNKIPFSDHYPLIGRYVLAH